MAWGLPSPRHVFAGCLNLLKLDEPVQQATGIEVTDIGADADRGRRGNRSVDAAGSGEAGRREFGARAGSNHRAEIERVRQINRAAGACSGATACACTAGERASGGPEQAIDSTEQVSEKSSHIVNSYVGWLECDGRRDGQSRTGAKGC